jgi:hypothetical protein
MNAMNIKDLDWRLSLFADASIFTEQDKEALKTARDIISALRAARNLSWQDNANILIHEVRECQTVVNEECITPCNR